MLQMLHFLQVTWRFCGNFYVRNTQNTPKIRMEQNFQDVSHKAMHDNNMEYFAAHFAKKITKTNPPTMLRHYVLQKTFLQ